MVIQPRDSNKMPCVVYFKQVNCMVYELYFNKTVIKEWGQGERQSYQPTAKYRPSLNSDLNKV